MKETIREVFLKEPYWGAGANYKWRAASPNDLCAFGVDMKLIRGGQGKGSRGTLLIHIGEGDRWGLYRISCRAALDNCEFWDSWMTIKGTKLAIIPRFCCVKLE